MKYSAEMLRCLADCDVVAIRKLAKHVWPNLPQPNTDAEALAMIHIARTQIDTMPLKLRAYSHRWLTDHSYPSMLPDKLRPTAERMYPRIVEAVGIACGGASEIGRQIAPLIRGAMEDVVKDAYAEGKTEPAFIKARMMEARKRTVRHLLGTTR